ncbi:MAG TPA: DUF488 domain-containing protein [Balneolaceae bacterium]|nr:DUF488 domain-containing protein [Balneolaceae bacterium]
MDDLAVRVKRIYEEASSSDGYRVLVDRIWPRGVSKEEAKLDEWLKEIAPSTKLRKWFNHDPEKFEEFKRRYKKELRDQKKLLDQLAEKAADQPVTLLFGARDEKHNQAIVLKEVLEERQEV